MDDKLKHCDQLKSCMFLKRNMNSNLQAVKKLVNEYCKWELECPRCVRKQMKLRGNAPSDLILPDGKHIDDSPLACKFIKSCALISHLSSRKKLYCETIKNKYCRSSSCKICKRFAAYQAGKELPVNTLPDGIKLKD